MRRALPLLVALGAGLALLAYSRRASAAGPVYLSDVDGYEAGQSTAVAPPADPSLPYLDWFDPWGPPAELEPFDAPIWGSFPDPEIPSLPGDVEQWQYPETGIPSGVWDMPTQQQSDANLTAFLHAIRWAEGTAGPEGYRTMFGGSLFNDYADHPRIAHRFTNAAGETLWTTAAGAYQFMAISPLPSGAYTRVNTWDRMQARLGLPDFSPQSQDAAAIELIREAGALDDVLTGKFASAISKVRGVWASLPGAGYNQLERSLDQLASVYASAGGTLTA